MKKNLFDIVLLYAVKKGTISVSFVTEVHITPEEGWRMCWSKNHVKKKKKRKGIYLKNCMIIIDSSQNDRQELYNWLTPVEDGEVFVV